jgi:hypothetical protein
VAKFPENQRVAKFAQKAKLGQSVPLTLIPLLMQTLQHQSIAKILTTPRNQKVESGRVDNGKATGMGG